MKWIVAVIGLLLALAGALTIQENLGIIQVERGWSSVISGSVVMTGGFVVLALAVVVARLESIAAVLARRPQAWPAHRVDSEEDADEAAEDAPPPRETGFRSVLRQGRELGLGAAPVPPPPREIPVEPLPIQAATLAPDVDDDAAYERFAPRFGPVTVATQPDETPTPAPTSQPAPPAEIAPPEETERPAAKADDAPAPSNLRGFRFHFPPLAEMPGTGGLDDRHARPDENMAVADLRGGIAPEQAYGEQASEEHASAADIARDRNDETMAQGSTGAEAGGSAEIDVQAPAASSEAPAAFSEAPAGSSEAHDHGGEPLEHATAPRAWDDAPLSPEREERNVEPAHPASAPADAGDQPDKPRRRPSLFPLRWQRPSADEQRSGGGEEANAEPEQAMSPEVPEVAASRDDADEGNLLRPAFGAGGEAEPSDRAQDAAPPRNPSVPARAPVQDTDWLERALSGVDEAPPSRGFAPKSLPRATFPLPVPAETRAPPARIVEPEPAPTPGPDILGRYEAQGTSYVMYSDGSIEAETSTGTFRFNSLTELKRFIEQRA